MCTPNLYASKKQYLAVFFFQFGDLLKLLANVLGMLNEHLRPDRGSYLYINESNIDSANLANLQTIPGFIIASDYDYASITHAYSKVFASSYVAALYL